MAILIDWLPYVTFFTGRHWIFLFLFGYLWVTFFYFRAKLKAEMLAWFFWIFVGWLFLRSALNTVLTYVLWLTSGPPSSYLLPPYQPLSYFLRYSLTHYGMTFLLTALAAGSALGFLFLFRRFRKRHERLLWTPGQEYIFLSGAFLVRWPLVIPYIFLGLMLAIGFFAVRRYALGGSESSPVVLNVMPFFAALTAPLLFFESYILSYLGLTALVMPF